MKITTYKSLLTGKKTQVTIYKGKAGYKNYLEYQISLNNGYWNVAKTDGFAVHWYKQFKGDKALKSLINLVWNS